MTQAEAGRRVGRNRYWVSQIETRAVRLDVVQFVLLCRALGLRSSQVINRLEKEVSPEEGDLFLPIRSKRLEYRIWWPLGGHFLTAKRTY